MNYFKFYNDAKKTLTENLVSMWATGHLKEQECLRELFNEKEPLIAPPVFQSVFPWESANETFEEHASKLHYLDDDFVKALSSIEGEHSFPAKRKPYKHQSESWKAMLCDKKTIAVTTGTGSGKTECFIIPVLQDLYRQRVHGDSEGVQAIFLYPLNALMKNQRDRIKGWCEALPKIVKYAIYNGEMPESGKHSESNEAEVKTREEMRQNPPQILFTNPTMLNYMMVRSADQPILQKSRGKLRWILLDEAHTYCGSAATELALQLRRVIEAFDVKIEDVNFAVTSATMGGEDAEQKLKKIVSQLTGKDEKSIQVINGKRIIPELDGQILNKRIPVLEKKYSTKIPVQAIKSLRDKLNSLPSMSAEKIASSLGINTDFQHSLELVNDLAEDSILPTRAHFFIRSVNGIFACVNPDCPDNNKATLDIGHLTTFKSAQCPHCGGNMLEIARCSDCGEFVVVGENNVQKGFRLRTNEISLEYTPFDIDIQDLEVDTSSQADSERDWEMFIYGKPVGTNPRKLVPQYHRFLFSKGTNTINHLFEKDLDANDIFTSLEGKGSGSRLCPHCGANDKFLYLRTSSALLGRALTPVLLENATPIDDTECKKDSRILYDGRRYITFTDSRQGTAKSALGMVQDVEKNWIRSSIYHYLASKAEKNGLTEVEQERLQGFEKLPPNLLGLFKKEYEILKAKAAGIAPRAKTVPWNEIKSTIGSLNSIRQLYAYIDCAKNNLPFNGNVVLSEFDAYLKALFLDQFGWIPRNSNTLENLGLIHIVYPPLKNAALPCECGKFGIKLEDWKDYLKICLDYKIRSERHYEIPFDCNDFLIQTLNVSVISEPNSKDRDVKWPQIENVGRSNKNYDKLILLLLAGLSENPNFRNMDISSQNGVVNGILIRAWEFIRDNFLKKEKNG